MSKIILFAVVGALVGLALAQFLPNLGKTDAAAALSNAAYALGKDKPYAVYSAVGAVVGAILGVFTSKREI